MNGLLYWLSRVLIRLWRSQGRACSRRITRHPEYRHLRLQHLEPREMLSIDYPLEGWHSAIFDDGVEGTLDFNFSRDVATVNHVGKLIPENTPRYGPDRLVTNTNLWSTAIDANWNHPQILGSGWDHDGNTPLAIVQEKGLRQLHFISGNDFDIVNTYDFNVEGADLLRGEEPGFRYLPKHAIVHNGLAVFFTQRDRQEGTTWIPEGVTFIYTQDLGKTFKRVEQSGGGYDVPAIAGYVSDGIDRGAIWSFSNAFPEKSAEDTLGAWFPWADYLFKDGAPKGGQIGLFRARRLAVGLPWIVEPNVVVSERWETSDAGGLHAHSAGMFSDGLVSFWGDVGYRNHMAHHLPSNLEDYSTATWTENREFQGAWSPKDNKVYRLGNQGASTAPGPNFGEVLVTGDEQPELVMKIEQPDDPSGSAIVSSLKSSFPGLQAGSSFAGRLSIWIHHLRGQGYVIRETNSRLPNLYAIHFSADGETWSTLLNLNKSVPYLYGNKILGLSDNDLHFTAIPSFTETRSPLLNHPGGLNLSNDRWELTSDLGEGVHLRRVQLVESLFVYEDTQQPVLPQPASPPPVMRGMPIWEITSDGAGTTIGIFDVADTVSVGGHNHWLTTWNYPLGNDGISPQLRLGSDFGHLRQSRWVTNNSWVPAYNFGLPDAESTTAAEQQIYLTTGSSPGPRRWLMIGETFVEGSSPSYPLAPGTTGSDELTTVGGFTTGEEWTVGLVFGLPQIGAFSSWFESAYGQIVRPIATLQGDPGNFIQIGFVRTGIESGQLILDIYEHDILTRNITFRNVRFDLLDRAQLVISGTEAQIDATLLLPRSAWGIQSAMARPVVPSCPDFNGDGFVDPGDFALMIEFFSHDEATHSMGDANHDGLVDPADFALMVGSWNSPTNCYAELEALSQPTPNSLPLKEILFSDALRTTISPLEWFAVQVHPEMALGQAQRESFVASQHLLRPLDVATNLVDIDPAENQVAESASTGTLVGVTASFSGSTGGTVTYALVNNGAGLFQIDPQTGVVRVANATWLDGPATHQITIEANLSVGDSETLSVDLLLTNTAPLPPTISGPDSSPVGAPVILQLTTTDPALADQNSPMIYTLDWNDGSALENVIGSTEGTWTSHTFFSEGIFTFSVTATDKDGGVSNPALHILSSEVSSTAGPADFNQDGVVDPIDFLLLTHNWLQPGNASSGDATGDGWVDSSDFAMLVESWLQTANGPASKLDAASRTSPYVQTGSQTAAFLTPNGSPEATAGPPRPPAEPTPIPEHHLLLPRVPVPVPPEVGYLSALVRRRMMAACRVSLDGWLTVGPPLLDSTEEPFFAEPDAL